MVQCAIVQNTSKLPRSLLVTSKRKIIMMIIDSNFILMTRMREKLLDYDEDENHFQKVAQIVTRTKMAVVMMTKRMIILMMIRLSGMIVVPKKKKNYRMMVRIMQSPSWLHCFKHQVSCQDVCHRQ